MSEKTKQDLKDELFKIMFSYIGINVENLKNVKGIIINRNVLINKTLYPKFINLMPKIKKFYSSDYMTALQSKSHIKQRFWLINLFRQILKTEEYYMDPEQKSMGYT